MFKPVIDFDNTEFFNSVNQAVLATGNKTLCFFHIFVISVHEEWGVNSTFGTRGRIEIASQKEFYGNK